MPCQSIYVAPTELKPELKLTSYQHLVPMRPALNRLEVFMNCPAMAMFYEIDWNASPVSHKLTGL